MNVQDFFNQEKVIDLSFFNFENAITAAYYANDKLEVQKVNKNFIAINEQLEVINSKLDHIEYDLHELEEK